MQQLWQKRGQRGLLDTSAQKMRRSGQKTYFVCQHVHQLGLSVGTAIGQSSLEVIPDALVRVQFGGVRRESHQVQPGSACKKFPHRFAAMDCAVVQQNDQMAADLEQQIAEECQNFVSLNVALIQLAVQFTMETFGADCNAGNGGNPIMTIPITQEGRLSHKTPCFSDRGDQEKAGFVNKHYMGCQPCGVFFTHGQTARFHSTMAASSRSTARLSGFWWLQPILCRSFPT